MQSQVVKVPLPKTPAEWNAARITKRERTLNDHVEDIHLRLLDATPIEGENQEKKESEKRVQQYELYHDAIYDEEATEGSLSYDNYQAAEMIRDYARANGRDPYVGDRKLSSIVKALNVVLRKYGMSRKQRAKTVHGEIVDMGENSNGD
jgi:hypothetical protein